MLKKLLKYDMRPMIKLWRVLGIIIPILAVSSALVIRYMQYVEEQGGYSTHNTVITIFGVFYVEIALFALIAMSIVNMVFIAKRMASDFYSDQGQLTFTLPVKREDLFLSKFINSLIWCGVSSASLTFTVLVYMLIVPVPEKGLISTEAFETLGALVKIGLQDGGFSFVYYVICTLVIITELELFYVNLLNWCIVKCQSAGGIGMCIGIYAGVVFGAMLLFLVSANGFNYTVEKISDGAYTAILMLLMLVVIVLLAVFDFYLFFAARDRVKHELNLS